MNVLFVHQNFPAQYRHLAPALAAQGHRVVALGQHKTVPLPGVTFFQYPLNLPKERSRGPAAELEGKLLVGYAAARAATELRGHGFQPDLIYAHPAWGEALFLKDIWPGAKLVCFWEFYYNLHGADVNFDPEFPSDPFAQATRLRVRNANNLLSLEAADWGVSPTAWQQSQFPAWARERISVVHDGIDTTAARPDPGATLQLPGTGLVLKAGDEVVTFVNRNLEPYRGYHVFMRSLPRLMELRPNAQIVIVGADGASYGGRPPQGKSWKQIFLDEVADQIDPARLHFTGPLPYASYMKLLQVSAAHVYLTYPFVLSWSLLEAMSAGCAVVASSTAPVTEVVRHGQNGLLFDFFDPVGLADTVAQVLADPAAFQPMRVQAREDVVARYNLQAVCLPRHIQLAHEIVEYGRPKSVQTVPG